MSTKTRQRHNPPNQAVSLPSTNPNATPVKSNPNPTAKRAQLNARKAKRKNETESESSDSSIDLEESDNDQVKEDTPPQSILQQLTAFVRNTPRYIRNAGRNSDSESETDTEVIRQGIKSGERKQTRYNLREEIFSPNRYTITHETRTRKRVSYQEPKSEDELEEVMDLPPIIQPVVKREKTRSNVYLYVQRPLRRLLRLIIERVAFGIFCVGWILKELLVAVLAGPIAFVVRRVGARFLAVVALLLLVMVAAFFGFNELSSLKRPGIPRPLQPALKDSAESVESVRREPAVDYELQNLKSQLMQLQQQQAIQNQQMANLLSSVKQPSTLELGPDYALYAAGSRVLSQQTSPEFAPTSNDWSSQIILLLSPSFMRYAALRGPETALTPTQKLGDCWPMAGNEGKLTVRLAREVCVESFILEHVETAMDVRSAPQKVEVWAVQPTQEEGWVQEGSLWVRRLASYTYSIEGPIMQQFWADLPTRTKAVQLRVLSNWGQEKFTCIYRFRVLGHLC